MKSHVWVLQLPQLERIPTSQSLISDLVSHLIEKGKNTAMEAGDTLVLKR